MTRWGALAWPRNGSAKANTASMRRGHRCDQMPWSTASSRGRSVCRWFRAGRALGGRFWAKPAACGASLGPAGPPATHPLLRHETRPARVSWFHRCPASSRPSASICAAGALQPKTSRPQRMTEAPTPSSSLPETDLARIDRRPRSTKMTWPTLPWIVAAALGCYTAGEVMRCRQRAPSVLGRCRVRRPKWTSSSVTGIRWRWSGWSVLRNAWPSCSMIRPTRASKPDGYLLGS
jgi:hypothetical protein